MILKSLYTVAHATSLTSIVVKGEEKLLSCIEAKRVRESRWKKKKALTPKLLESIHNVTRGVAKPDENQREDNEWYEGAKRKQVKECCQKVKEQLLIEEIHAHEEKNGSYKTQGEFMKLINDMEANLDWKSFMYGMGKGTLKFLLNSSLNTLPTAANLKLWKKQTSNKDSNTNMKNKHKTIITKRK